MVAASDQKTDWNTGEAIVWLHTRDHDRVALMWEMNEVKAIALALFDWNRLPRVIWRMERNGEGRQITAAASAEDAAAIPAAQAIEPPGTAELSGSRSSDDQVDQDRVLQLIMRNVQTRKLRMTLIKEGPKGPERLPVSAAQANDLELRISDDCGEPVVAWSRSRRERVGTSPWFSRQDAIRAWPERVKKTAAVTGRDPASPPRDLGTRAPADQGRSMGSVPRRGRQCLP